MVSPILYPSLSGADGTFVPVGIPIPLSPISTRAELLLSEESSSLIPSGDETFAVLLTLPFLIAFAFI